MAFGCLNPDCQAEDTEYIGVGDNHWMSFTMYRCRKCKSKRLGAVTHGPAMVNFFGASVAECFAMADKDTSPKIEPRHFELTSRYSRE